MRPAPLAAAARLFGSAWCFYFRWPVVKLDRFENQGVLLGPFLQAAMFLLGVGVFAILGFDGRIALLIGMAWLSASTGFFHEDGFADAADSLGVSKFDRSAAVLDKITAAFKDPRLGTFGVSALALLWGWRFLAAFAYEFPPLMWAGCLMVSRANALVSGVVLSKAWPPANNARSSHLMGTLKPMWTVLMVSGALLGGLLLVTSAKAPAGPWLEPATWHVLLRGATGLILACMGGALFTYALARRSETLNGDILGASACATELLAGLLLTRAF